MNKTLSITLTALVSVMLSATAFSQTFFLRETFPNEQTGGSHDYDDDGSIAGQDFGSWSRTTTSQVRARVVGSTFTSSPYALLLQTTGDGAETATVSSANINLSGVSSGLCATNGLALKFQLRRSSAVTSHSMQVEFSNDGGVTFNNFGPPNVLSALANQNQWYTISISIPDAPASYWVSDFRVRFVYSRSGTSSDATVLVDDIVITDPTVPDFSGAFTETTNAGTGFAVGDVYRYNSVVTFPEEYYAEVRIEAIQNAVIDVFDNNAAGVANRFQPRILPNATLNVDREGYVQFAITFKKASDNTEASLTGLRYRHYDIDGSSATGTGAYTFRETGWITGHGSILVNNPSDLVDAGEIVDAGPPNPTTWRKILGELEEHDGLSNDPDVYFTAVYGPTSTVRFRLGYLFDQQGNANLGTPSREYGTEFGCFNLVTQVPLPVKLLSFGGTFLNNAAALNWETVNEENFDRFEIERSSNGSSFASIGSKLAQPGGFDSRKQYNHFDDLSAVSGDVFYYRLKMVDADGKFKYSNVIMIRRDQKAISGLLISPNPVYNGAATIRFSARTTASVEVRVMDMTGRTVLQQQNKVYEGNNSIAVNNLDRLQPGMYVLRLINGDDISVVKFSVTK